MQGSSQVTTTTDINTQFVTGQMIFLLPANGLTTLLRQSYPIVPTMLLAPITLLHSGTGFPEDWLLNVCSRANNVNGATYFFSRTGMNIWGL